jgi:hypothetical protein
MALISGLLGYVNVDGASKSFGKWRLRTKTNKPRVNNFKSAVQRIVSGLIGAELEVDGPWDVGTLGMAAGGTYSFQLGVTPSIFLAVTAIVDWDASNDVEDAPRIRITGDSDGLFTLVVP